MIRRETATLLTALLLAPLAAASQTNGIPWMKAGPFGVMVHWITQPRKQRGRAERHEAEHQVTHHLGRPAHSHPATAITLLQQAVHPLSAGAFFEAFGLNPERQR